MPNIQAERRYLRGRLRVSLDMAAAAAGPCAQLAHETLARLYREAIEGLSEQRPRYHPVVIEACDQGTFGGRQISLRDVPVTPRRSVARIKATVEA